MSLRRRIAASLKREQGSEKASPRTRAEGRKLVASVIVGVVTAAAVMAAALIITRQQPERWSSRSTLVILPGPHAEPSELPRYYEALTRGQIVATYAELIRGRYEADFRRSAGDGTSVSLRISVVPDTSIIAITAEATSSSTANRSARRMAELAATYVRDLNQPYTASIVSRGTASKSGVPTSSLLIIALIVALALGLLAQQAVYQLGGLQLRFRTSRSEEPPSPNGPGSRLVQPHAPDQPPLS